MSVLTPEAPSLSPPREVSELDCEDSQLQNLWHAVIGRAKADLQNKKTGRLQREDTATWVRGDPCFPGDSTDYFAEVCDLAGVEAAPVREKILQSVEFPSAKREEIAGLVVEPKYCERCSRSFLRAQGSKQATCASCTALESSRVATQPLASAVRVGIAYLESDPDARTGEPKKPYTPGDLLRMTCLAANVPLNQAEAQRRWPWLGEDVETPCDCETLISPNALLVLQHLYETHVRAREDWPPEQLIAWVQKHEHLAHAPEQAEPPQDTEQPSASPIGGFADAPCVSYEPAMMESADAQTACAN